MGLLKEQILPFKGSTLKKKKGANSFLEELAIIEKGGKKEDGRVAFHESVPIHLKNLCPKCKGKCSMILKCLKHECYHLKHQKSQQLPRDNKCN